MSASAATVTDLSTTGAGLTTETAFDIPGAASSLRRKAADSVNFHCPPGDPSRLRSGRDQPLGCEFDQPDEVSRRQIIGYVYGDSRRLKYFYKAKYRPNARLLERVDKPAGYGGKGLAAQHRRNRTYFWTLLPGCYTRSYQSIGRQKGGADSPMRSFKALYGSELSLVLAVDSSAAVTVRVRSKYSPDTGSPATGHDGQLQLHRSRSRALERREGNTPFHLRQFLGAHSPDLAADIYRPRPDPRPKCG